jgi:hypothetical protein
MAGLENPHQAWIGLDFRRNANHPPCAGTRRPSSYPRLPNDEPVEVLMGDFFINYRLTVDVKPRSWLACALAARP